MLKRILLLLVAFLLPVHVLAMEGIWHSFSLEQPLENLSYLVEEFSGTLEITFLGDCTLGGEEKSRNSARGFVRTVEKYGLEYPLSGLLPLTENDDLTLSNLEGVLSDRNLEKVKKTYNFSGPTAYTGILKAGSVEAVTLANNHSHDYGESGYRDTKDALQSSEIGFLGREEVAVWEIHGLRIGFTGSCASVSGSYGRLLEQQMALLKDLGCDVVIHVMHAGEEYTYLPDRYQYQIAEKAIENGADLVVGHHPHVLQGISTIKNIPVVWSLGNCCFGGTTHAKDNDALALQVRMTFEENDLTGLELRLYPVSITSGIGGNNNYAPCLMKGQEAERVVEKVKKYSDVDLDVFSDETGSGVSFTVR